MVEHEGTRAHNRPCRHSLVLALAEAGLRVNVNDLNHDSLDTLKSGRLPFIEYGAQCALAKVLADIAEGSEAI
jgi:hypothetical protein